MANKFNLLGRFINHSEDELVVSVRKNFRDYDSQYIYDEIVVHLGLGLSPSLIKSFTQSDILNINGRLENDDQNKLILVAEHIIRIRDLEEHSEES